MTIDGSRSPQGKQKAARSSMILRAWIEPMILTYGQASQTPTDRLLVSGSPCPCQFKAARPASGEFVSLGSAVNRSPLGGGAPSAHELGGVGDRRGDFTADERSVAGLVITGGMTLIRSLRSHSIAWGWRAPWQNRYQTS